MQKFYLLRLFLLLLLCIPVNKIMSQCSSYPVPFEQRISQSVFVVLGKVIDKHCYIDAATGSVNTLNKFRVAAWLKNYQMVEDIYIITLGGVVGNRAMLVQPALQLDTDHEYLLMLEADNPKIDDKDFRKQHPQALQLLNYADAQGSLTNENNYYHDLYYRTPKTETKVFEQIQNLTGQLATKPGGEQFFARPVISLGNDGVAAISGFTPTTTNGGTIVPAENITISGSGFGTAAGTVFFTNADDGGATFTSTGVASDNVAWSDASIQVKTASRAGTGPINVNLAMTSGSNLTISYAHLNINSTFSGFGTSTRQRYYLKDKNGLGGYTFTYNTAFDANTPAKAAFQRSLLLWRCNTLINWRSGAATSAITTAAADGVNIVTFDGTLPAGVLGRATSRFSGSANGACNLTNTVWCLDELDIQFYPDPPTAGFTWEYGPALPSVTEYDFESVASHELGHLHGGGHVINSLDMMNFSLANGTALRVHNANNIAMGVAKMNYSIAATCLNPAGVVGPMIALTAGSCTLPVDLTSFKGERKNTTTNKLYWSTAQEINNRGFNLQRSIDAINFKNIAFIPGAGSGNQSNNYAYLDTKAGIGAWYYRLQQMDIDGAEKLSSTVFIDADDKTSVKVWANEGGDKVFVYLKSSNNNTASFQILNSLGQQLLVKQLVQGTSETGVGHLPKGIYYYQVQYQSKTISGKLFLGNR